MSNDLLSGGPGNDSLFGGACGQMRCTATLAMISSVAMPATTIWMATMTIPRP